MDTIDDKKRAINPEAKALNRGKLGSAPPVKAARDNEEVPEHYSEFGKIPVLKAPEKKTPSHLINATSRSAGPVMKVPNSCRRTWRSSPTTAAMARI